MNRTFAAFLIVAIINFSLGVVTGRLSVFSEQIHEAQQEQIAKQLNAGHNRMVP